MIAVALVLAGLVAATCVHEAGHLAVATALRLPCRPVLTRYGPAALIGRDDLTLTRRQVRLTAAGGPLANVAAAFAVCAPLHLGSLALLNVLVAFVNLLPLPRSDGMRILMPGRALRLARGERSPEPTVRKSGGYQPIYDGPPPTQAPPKRVDALASAVPPRHRRAA